jgi:hypothetical protein
MHKITTNSTSHKKKKTKNTTQYVLPICINVTGRLAIQMPMKYACAHVKFDNLYSVFSSATQNKYIIALIFPAVDCTLKVNVKT